MMHPPPRFIPYRFLPGSRSPEIRTALRVTDDVKACAVACGQGALGIIDYARREWSPWHRVLQVDTDYYPMVGSGKLGYTDAQVGHWIVRDPRVPHKFIIYTHDDFTQRYVPVDERYDPQYHVPQHEWFPPPWLEGPRPVGTYIDDQADAFRYAVSAINPEVAPPSWLRDFT